jgi:hypothetical protein
VASAWFTHEGYRLIAARFKSRSALAVVANHAARQVGYRGVGAMPIRPLLDGGVFSLEDITAITAAFEDTLRVLGLVDRKDPAVHMVAKRMIELARHERNPILLRDAVLESFKNGSQSAISHTK